MPNPLSRRRTLKNPPLRSKDPVDLDRHRRKCQICNHPSRELIEESFINWHPNYRVIQIYGLDVDSFYRHAHAFGLYTKRSQNVRSALENIIERGVETPISGDTMIRAVRAYSCLTEGNPWVEPVTHLIVSKGAEDVPPPLKRAARAALAEAPIDVTPEPSPTERISNNAFPELENDLTH
jgi:hypothetical protein